jgi:hypothetical protein
MFSQEVLPALVEKTKQDITRKHGIIWLEN